MPEAGDLVPSALESVPLPLGTASGASSLNPASIPTICLSKLYNLFGPASSSLQGDYNPRMAGYEN